MKAKISKKTLLLALCILGIGISLYLSFVKLSSNTTICVFGSCDTVQASKYAEIFGIPVAVLGVVYYLLLFTLIFYDQKKYTNWWLFWGIIFSSYLTFLEIFVIKAICGWCVVSFANIILLYVIHFLGPCWFYAKKPSR